MEVSGVVLRQIPCVSGSVADGRYSGHRSVSEFSGYTRMVGFRNRKFRGIMCNNEFADKGHTNYYFERTRCGGEEKEKVKVMEKEKKAMKKKAKVLKSLSKNLNMFSSIGFGLDPESGLVGEIQTKTISEATEILVKQLEQLKAEEKQLKKQRKEEKAKAKAMKTMTDMDSESSSSSESSESDCDKGKVVDINYFRNKAKPSLEPLQPEASVATLPRIQEDVSYCKNTGDALQLALLQSAAASTAFPSMVNPGQTLKTVEAVSVVGLPLKRVEVCMGGKCKKSGGAVLLDEFQKAMTGLDGSAVACKCMGKCRDGPNVRVVHETDASVMTDSVRTPSKTVFVGVGLQDVETIVTSFFDEECSRERLGYVSV
ncbi:Diacylglycerol O-acyltransferase 3 [Cardamine amara subsp. amara]|uniref:Diacylglycerol O-acyltransferase 3 n=1 Tax=Cardamine amara subsp. amara TaxID=228776 RepID=A0ABD1ACC6_CARAN